MKRAYVVNQADLRMDGDLAMNVKRVLPVSQADFATAVANGQQWNVKQYRVVNTLDNMRGGTLRILKVNAPAPGVQRAFLTSEAVMVTLMGVSPLVLPDAVDADIPSLIAFGGTEQGLPAGYTALTFVENTSGTYIDLGVPFNDADSVLEVTMTAVNNTNYIASAREGNTMQGIAGSSTAFKAYIDPVSLTSTTTKTAGHKYKFTFTANNGNATFKTEDLTASTSDTQTTVYTVSQTQPTAHLGLFGNSYGNVTDAGADFYGLKYTVAGEVVLNLVPCRKDATIGVFDLVSRQFLTPTQGSLMAGLDTTLAPTPDTPIDIVSNNGVLKIRHQSGLPWGYTLLNFVANASGTGLDTGIYDDIDDFSVEMRVSPSLGSWYICQSRANSTAPIYGLSGASSGAKISFGAGFSGGTSSVTSDINRITSHTYTVIGSHKNGVTTLYVKDETTEEEDTQTTTYDTNNFTAAPSAVGIWGQTSNTVSSNNGIYYLKIRKGGVLVADYVPCQYNGENGFYDLVTETFLGATAGTINAGSPVSDPAEIYADGIVETITVKGPNLWNMNSPNLTKSVPGFLASSIVISNDGTISATNNSGSLAARFILELSADNLGLINGETYTVKVWAVENNFTTGRDSTIIVNGSQSAFRQSSPISKTWTQSGNNPVRMTLYFAEYSSGSTTSVRVQVSKASSIEDYMPYNEETATAEMLLSIGNYTDEQEIIDGTVTRKVGVKVLDGTEDWIQTTTSLGVYRYRFEPTDAPKLDGGRGHCMSTHFFDIGGVTTQDIGGVFASTTYLYFIPNQNVDTVAKWKTFLADQYAAGTPVIVVYPLETATTETVTEQPMQTVQGDNIAEITQASLDNLELQVTYMAGVQLTVEEVEDAQLSPDVEVTIQ